MRRNLETGKGKDDGQLSDLEAVKLTEWLIFKIKTIYGRPVFEGDTSVEASAIRQEWTDLVLNIGKNGVLAMIDYLLSGHHTVPSFPPAPVEFKKCYRAHVAPSLRAEGIGKHLPHLTSEQKQIGYRRVKELLEDLKSGCLVEKDKVKSARVA